MKFFPFRAEKQRLIKTNDELKIDYEKYNDIPLVLLTGIHDGAGQPARYGCRRISPHQQARVYHAGQQ